MSIAKAVSIVLAAPCVGVLLAGAVAACGTSSPEGAKDPAPAVSLPVKDPGSVVLPTVSSQVEAPPSSSPLNGPPVSSGGAEGQPDPPDTPLGIPKPGPQKSMKECTATWEGMQQKVDQFDAAHKACKADSDCATVSSRACLSACETAVSQGAVKDRKALMSQINKNECQKFLSGCMNVMPIAMPSCPMYVPSCKGGQCVATMK